MSNVVNMGDFRANYSKYLENAIRGNEILLGKRGRPVAKLIPLDTTNQPRVPGALKGKIWMSEDFDKPLTGLWQATNNKI